jgi:hypothetical protein
VHIPLLFLGCLVALVLQLQRAGWSLRRAERRPTYWSAVGLLLSGAVWSRDALPGSPVVLVLGALAGLGLLWGFWTDLRGRQQ